MILLPFFFMVSSMGYFRRTGAGWRESLVWIGVLVALGVGISTEVLSYLHVLGTTAVTVFWITASIASLWFVGREPNRSTGSRREFSKLWWVVALFSVPLVLVGAVWPPTNFDSLVYHLPRVFHWIQNASVEHYQTPIFRQLYQPPLLEYLLLHAKLLGAGEIVFSLLPVALLFFAGVAASLVADEVFPSVHVGAVACLLVVLHPISVMQATNPKNDILLEAVLLIWLWVYFRFSKSPSRSLFAGLVVIAALLILTKGTSWVFVPAIVALLVFQLRKSPVRKASGAFAVSGLVAVALATALLLPHHFRNWETFGSPLGPRAGQGEFLYGNEKTSASALLSNVYRNTAQELKSPVGFLNHCLQQGGERLHSALGFALNDPATTWPGTSFDVSGPWDFNEDALPNPLGVVSILVACLLFPWRSCGRGPLVLLGFLASGVFLFCLLLKWQPWHPRLHIPFFGVGYVLVAVWLVKQPSQWLRTAILGAIASVALLCLWSHTARPLRDVDLAMDQTREQRFERLGRGYVADLEVALAFLGNRCPSEVCLVMGGNEWEYPFWRLREKQSVTWRWTSRQGRGRPEPRPLAVGAFVLQVRDAPLDADMARKLPPRPILENDTVRLFEVTERAATP